MKINKLISKQKKGSFIIPSGMCIACGEMTYKNGECSTCGYVGG